MRKIILSVLFISVTCLAEFYGSAGSAGGGSGNVVGPNQSTLYGTAIFGGTNGQTLLDSVISGKGTLVSPGDGVDAPSPSNFGLAFSGSIMNNPGTTGWKVVPVGAIDFLELYVQGINILQMTGTTVTPAITYESGVNPRPDTGDNNINFGGAANAFNRAFYNAYTFGGSANNAGSSPARKCFMYDNLNSAGGNFTAPCLGSDTSSGSEWYFASIDLATGTHFDGNFNIIHNTQTMTTVSAPPSTTATAGISITLKGADNTSTGAGGDLILSGSDSASSTDGEVFIPAIDGGPASVNTHSGFVPMWYDPGSSEFCVNDSGAVKCAAMH